MGKTIRFGDLVRGSGRPEVVTLWVEPKKDPQFSRAVRENRVLTIHGDPASHRKEFGQIGFHQEQGAMYLIFPRPLPEAPESRIVGINYQLTEERQAKSPLVSNTATTPRSKPKWQKSERPPKPELKKFDVLIRRRAVIEDTQIVKAQTEEEARQAATEAIKHKRFALNHAIMSEEVVNVTTRT
jgi:hypothetical protein